MESNWLTFWEIVLTIGLSAFALLVLAVIPLGARDIRRMFAILKDQSASDQLSQDSDAPEE